MVLGDAEVEGCGGGNVVRPGLVRRRPSLSHRVISDESRTAIVIIFAIYIRTGNEILRMRRSLHYFSNRSLDESLPDGNVLPLAKTTEVIIPSEAYSWPNDDQNGAIRPPSERLYPEPISTGVGREEAYQRNDEVLSTQNRLVQPTVLEAQRVEQGNNVRIHRAVYESNTAAWSYAKYTLFFFTALLVTWVPPTCNRMYALVHGRSLVPLEVLTSIVLPLQGFFNCTIYAITSWRSCKELWRTIRAALCSCLVSEIRSSPKDDNFNMVRLGSRSDHRCETESTRGLAH